MAIQVFGGNQVQSAYPSYIALDITETSLTLVWPSAYVDVPYTDPNTGISYQVLALSMDVTTGVANHHTITLPDATQTSVGQIFNITNVGASAFTLNTSDGNPLQIADTGITYYATLTDNTTSAGVWRVITLGAGTSEASAIALAGNGLVANVLPFVEKLNTNIAVVSVNIPPTIDVTFRAKLIVWTGGAATLSLPLITDVPAGFYVSFSNQGEAKITIQPGEGGTTISGEPTIDVSIQQSLTIISDGTKWQTLGFGQNQFAVDTTLTLDVSEGIDIILTNTQAANIIQRYIGALGANITVFFPAITSDWFIYNNTTGGSNTLSVQLAGPLGTSYVIPQGSIGIFYSDGTSLFVAPTSLSLINGTEEQPSLSFLSNPGTGIYLNPADQSIRFTQFGSDICIMNNDSGIGTFLVADNNGDYFEVRVGNTGASLLYENVLGLRLSTSGSQILAQDGSIAAPSMAFLSNPGTGMFTTNSDTIIGFSFNGTALFGIGVPVSAPTGGGLIIISSTGTYLEIISYTTGGSIISNGNNAINIDLTGTVTFPTNPATTLNSLMPTGAAAGSIVYYNGTQWVNLGIGDPGQTLTVTGATTIGWE